MANRHLTRARLLPAIGLVCLLAQVLLATAPLWHSHDGDCTPDRCATCYAVSIPQDSGTAPDTAVAAFVFVGYCTTEPNARPISALRADLRARGPPSA